METFKPILNPIVKGLLCGTEGGGTTPVAGYFLFNGSDQDATMPGWSPLGIDYRIEATITAEESGDFTRAIIGQTTGLDNYISLNTNGGEVLRYEAAGVGSGIDYTGDFDDNELTVFSETDYTGTKIGIVSVGETAVNSSFNVPFDDPRTRIANWGGESGYFKGVIADLKFIDNAPLQDQTVTAGNDDRLVVLDSELAPTRSAGDSLIPDRREIKNEYSTSYDGPGAGALPDGPENNDRRREAANLCRLLGYIRSRQRSRPW